MNESAAIPASFRVLYLAPLRADAAHATNDAWTAPVRFTKAALDETMAKVAPGIEIDLNGQRVTHAFRAMRAFRPDVLMEQVGVLRALRAGASNVPPPISAGKPQNVVDDILKASALPPIDATLEAIVSHPVVRGLERAWLGLQLLTEHADADKGVVVEAMSAQADEVDVVLERIRGRADAEPFDLLVVDHAVGASASDRERLARWAALAEGLGAPLVANALPEVLGVDSLAALGKGHASFRTSSDPRAAAFRAEATKPVMRWVCLAMNGPLARAPHQGPVRRTFGVGLDEHFVQVLGPCVAVAALACESYAAKGWALPPAGALGGRPLHAVTGVSVSTEAIATADASLEAAEAGIALVVSAPKEEVVSVLHAPVLYRASTGAEGAAAAELLLGDELFVARITRAVEKLAAAIPASTPEAAARDVVKVALAKLWGDAPKTPDVEVSISGSPRRLELVLHPKAFHGVRIESVKVGASLAS